MQMGVRVRELRESKGVSQGEIGRRTGLIRSYLSRIENGHTLPSVAILERIAEALGMRLYEFFSFNEEGVAAPTPMVRANLEGLDEDGVYYSRLRWFASRIPEEDRSIFLALARALAARAEVATPPGPLRPKSASRGHPVGRGVGTPSGAQSRA